MKPMVMVGCAAVVAAVAWFKGGSDVEVISHGEEVRVENHVEVSGLTLIEFSAEW